MEIRSPSASLKRSSKIVMAVTPHNKNIVCGWLQSLCEVGHRGTGFLMCDIVIDTETTGLDPLGGHGIVEIGAVELVNRSLTGQTYHRYLCPERCMPADALA